MAFTRVCWRCGVPYPQVPSLKCECGANVLAGAKRIAKFMLTLQRYGMTWTRYVTMFKAQDGHCAICGEASELKPLVVDHNHSTGRVRALLCYRCNIGLGQFKDNIELLQKALTYLRKFAR